MKLGGLQKLTLLDYPGKMACTVFLPGCNFRCPFCHNASFVVPEQLEKETGIEEEELFRFLKRRQGILEGVCVTGGEPLLHPEIFSLLAKIKELGYPVKLDTNGSFPDRLKKAVDKRLVDFVAMDLKNSREGYPETIGRETIDLNKIEESVSFLLGGYVDYEFRTTFVKEYHGERQVRQMADWILGAKAWYFQNFVDSGYLVGEKKLHGFSKEELEELLNIAKEKQIPARIRGEK